MQPNNCYKHQNKRKRYYTFLGALGEEESTSREVEERSNTTVDDETTPELTRYSALFLSSSVTTLPSNIFSFRLLEIACALPSLLLII